MPLRAGLGHRGRVGSDSYLRRLFTVGTCGKTQRSNRAAILAVFGTGFDPGKKFPFREYRAAAELLIRDSLFVDQIVECRPRGGNALLGHKAGGVIDIHSVCLDGFVLAAEIGEFRKNGIHCIADDRLQLCRSSNDYGVVHSVVSIWLNTGPRPGVSDRSQRKDE